MSVFQKIKTNFFSEFSFFMAAPALVWQGVLVVVPLTLILAFSFINSTTWTLTLSYYSSLMQWSHVLILWWSFLLALVTTMSCLLIGYPLAYWLARKTKKLKNFFIFFLIIPFCTNLLVMVYSWIFILERYGILNTFLMKIGIISHPITILNTIPSVMVVAIYCYLPFMVLPIFSSLEKIETAILEASYDLGGTFWQTFFKVIVPLSWPGIRTGIFLVFVPAFGEYSIPLLMGGDKYMFVGIMIVRYVFMIFDLSSGAAFTMLSGIFLLVSAALVTWCIKRLLCKI